MVEGHGRTKLLVHFDWKSEQGNRTRKEKARC